MLGIDKETRELIVSFTRRAVEALEIIAERLDVIATEASRGESLPRFRPCHECKQKVDVGKGAVALHINVQTRNWCEASGKPYVQVTQTTNGEAHP